jgi:hypothetical protein
LVLKSGALITFDSRSGVSSLAQVLVLDFLWFFLVDPRWIGGGSCMILRIGAFRMWLSFSFRTGSLILKGVFFFWVSSDDEWYWISF